MTTPQRPRQIVARYEFAPIVTGLCFWRGLVVKLAFRQILQSCLNLVLLSQAWARKFRRQPRRVCGISVHHKRHELTDVDAPVDPDRDAVIVIVNAHAVFRSVLPEPFEYPFGHLVGSVHAFWGAIGRPKGWVPAENVQYPNLGR